MSTLVIVAIGWILFGLWRGYQRGAVKVFAGLLALVIGYIACFIWGWPLAQSLAGVVPPFFQWPVATGGLFIAVAIAVNLIARPLTKQFAQSRASSIIGAFGNAIAAAVMLMTALWAAGLVLGATNNLTWHSAAQRFGYHSQQRLVQLSNWFMAHLIGTGMSAVGASDQQVAASVALAQMPVEGIRQLQTVTGSDATKNLIHNPDLKQAMATGNINQITQHPDFVAFAKQPGMTNMLALVPREANQSQNQALAETIVDVWQRVEAIKQSDQAQEVFADPEVQALMQSGNAARLMAHPKMQPLVSLLINGEGHAKAATKPIALEVQAPEIKLEETNSAPVNEAMFKWRGENGKLNFSTWDRIPKQYREGAELINL